MKKLSITIFAILSLGALAFEKYMIGVPDELNPKEGIKGVTKMVERRGGNYLHHPYGCRTVCRWSCLQNWPSPHVGFRLAMD